MEIVRDDGFRIVRMPEEFDGAPPHLYLSNCVLSGPYYTNNGRPAFLQAEPNSNVLRIVGGWTGLVLNFALGRKGPFYANKTVRHYDVATLVIPPGNENKAFWVWAQLEPDDRITFGLDDKSLVDIYHSRTMPSNPKDGDYWFDIEENVMKRFSTIAGDWTIVRRIIIGKIGIGSDGYIYSMTSYAMRKDFAELYPEYINFDGVSFVTGGQYVAENYEKWYQNTDITEAVTYNYQAFKAMVFSDYVDDIFDRIFSHPGSFAKALSSPYADLFIWGAEPYETRENVLQQLFNNLTKTRPERVTLSAPSQRPERYKNSKIISINYGTSILLDLDFTDYKMLRFYAGRLSSADVSLRVRIGSTTLLNISAVSSWIVRTLDISDYNGIQTLEIHNGSSNNNYLLGVTGIILLRG